MSEDERIKILTLESPISELDPNPVDILLRLIWMVGKSDKSKTLIAMSKNIYFDCLAKDVYEDKFSTLFEIQMCTKTHRVNNLQGNHLKDKAAYEAKLLQNLRICDVDDFCDSIFIDRELVKNPDKLLEYFDKISQDRMFCELPELRFAPNITNLPKSSDTKKSEPWFDIQSGNTIGSIYLGLLDYSVTKK